MCVELIQQGPGRGCFGAGVGRSGRIQFAQAILRDGQQPLLDRSVVQREDLFCQSVKFTDRRTVAASSAKMMGDLPFCSAGHRVEVGKPDVLVDEAN